ncbi:hypothetical protein JQ633_27265 [Bradyrhizobium tropiciagri]|uniref:hypothetical protein n=1 Tax=Bradyrhizobium tropiciagri TaxID=312253 RepID=UPI001BA97B95|nr:hypothetical protein [Bradyrhizobium tropiciagri]MBR0874087.1 hypothetical protein [Bradyrhizobium tropiciagri]
MTRLLAVLVSCAFCLLPDAASAAGPEQPGSQLTDVSSRQRCACGSWHRSAGIRHYRLRTAYLIGYDPLPYRYGSTFVFERPYRYYRW